MLKHYGEGYVVPQVKLEQKNAKVSDLFTRQTWRPHLYSGLFWFCQVGPFFAIFTFLTPVFNGLGVTDAVTVEIWLNVVQLAGAVFGLYLLHKLTRRGFVNWTFALMFLTLLSLGLFGNAPLWLTVSLFAFYLFMAPAANNIQYVYPSEIFDTRVRGTGVGFSAAFSRISAAGATYLFPLLLAELGTSATLLLVSAFPLLGLILSILWAPETKEKTLR